MASVNKKTASFPFHVAWHAQQSYFHPKSNAKYFENLIWDVKFRILQFCIPEAMLEWSCYRPGLLIRAITPILAVSKGVRQAMCMVLRPGAGPRFLIASVEKRCPRNMSVTDQAGLINLSLKAHIDTLQSTWQKDSSRIWGYKRVDASGTDTPDKLQAILDRDRQDLVVLDDIVRRGARGGILHEYIRPSHFKHQTAAQTRNRYLALGSELRQLDLQYHNTILNQGQHGWDLDVVIPFWVHQRRNLMYWSWETQRGYWRFALRYSDTLGGVYPTPLDIRQAVAETFYMVLGIGDRIIAANYYYVDL